MALVVQTLTLKWDMQRLVEKLNFRLKWSILNEIQAEPLTLKWDILNNVARTLGLNWGIDRVIPLSGRSRIYTMPLNKRLFIFKGINDTANLIVTPIGQVVHNDENITNDAVLVVHTL